MDDSAVSIGWMAGLLNEDKSLRSSLLADFALYEAPFFASWLRQQHGE